jgi:hypothetical protein
MLVSKKKFPSYIDIVKVQYDMYNNILKKCNNKEIVIEYIESKTDFIIRYKIFGIVTFKIPFCEISYNTDVTLVDVYLSKQFELSNDFMVYDFGKIYSIENFDGECFTLSLDGNISKLHIENFDGYNTFFIKTCDVIPYLIFLQIRGAKPIQIDSLDLGIASDFKQLVYSKQKQNPIKHLYAKYRQIKMAAIQKENKIYCFAYNLSVVKTNPAFINYIENTENFETFNINGYELFFVKVVKAY